MQRFHCKNPYFLHPRRWADLLKGHCMEVEDFIGSLQYGQCGHEACISRQR